MKTPTRAISLSIAGLLAACSHDGGAPDPAAGPPAATAPAEESAAPPPAFGPVTLLTVERPPPAGSPQLHGWHHASLARQSLGALAHDVSVLPAAVASFDVDEGVEVTEQAIAQALHRQGFVLRALVRSDTGWVLECAHLT